MTGVEARELAQPHQAVPAEWRKAELVDPEGALLPDAVAQVEARLRRAQAWQPLIELYEFAAARAPTSELGRQLWLRAGQVWQENLHEPRRAERFYLRALGVGADDARALSGMMEVCLDGERWEEAIDVMERLSQTVHGAERAALLVRAARICSERLGQNDRALRALRVAYEADRLNPQVLNDAVALLFEEERWGEIKALLDDAVGHAAAAGHNVEDLARNYRELGEHLMAHAVFHGLAESCFEQAQRLGDQQALPQLDALVSIRSDWKRRVQELVATGLETRDKSKAALLYVEAAELCLVYGEDAIKADEHLNRAILLRGFRPVLRYLEHVYMARGQRDELISRLNGLLASISDGTTKIEVLFRVAQLMAVQVQQSQERAEALVQALRRVLAVDPAHREATHMTVVLLSELGRHREAAEVLEGHLGTVSDAYRRLALHLQLGHIYAERLGDSFRSRDHFEAVLTLRPDHLVAATALRALYKDAREGPLLFNALKVLVDCMPDLTSRQAVLQEMEQVASGLSPDEAFAVARRWFDLHPLDPEIRQRFESLGMAQERYGVLAADFEEAAGRVDGPAAVDLLRAAARIYDDKLPRPQDALRCYRAVLQLDPQDTQAQQALEELLRQQDDPQALVELLQVRLQQSRDPEQRRILLVKMGDVYDRELGETDRAIETFQEVLLDEPHHPTALASLDSLYGRKGDAEAQASILSLREALSDNPQVALTLALRRARLLEESLDQPEQAVEVHLGILEKDERQESIDALQRLLRREIRPRQVAQTLEQVYARTGDSVRRVDMLSVLIQHDGDGRRRKEHALKAAELSEQRLDNAHAALDYLAIAASLDPADDGLRDRVVDLSVKLASPDRASRVFEQTLQRHDLPAEARAATAVSLGELRVRSQRIDEGIRSLHKALQLCPGFAPALTSLERLLVEQGRHAELADVLVHQLEHAAHDDEGRLRLWSSLADVRGDHLGDHSGSIEALREILRLRPGHRSALSKLTDLLEKTGQHRELIRALQKWLERVDDPAEEAALAVRLAYVARVHLHDVSTALESFRRALDRVPEHGPAIEGLQSMLSDPEGAARAGAMLAPILRRQGRDRELVKALHARLSDAAADERPELYRELIQLSQTLSEPVSAYEWAVAAFREGHFDAEGLVDLAAAAQRSKALLQVLEDRIESEDAPAPLWRVLARLADGPAADPAKARKAWERLVRLDPNDVEALEALERLTEAAGDPRRLAEVLAARADAATDPDVKARFLSRAAAQLEQGANAPNEALALYEQASAAQPDDLQLLGERIRLYRSSGRAGDRRQALRHVLSLQTAPGARAETLFELGETAEELADAAGAVDAYARALELGEERAQGGLTRMLDSEAAPGAARALEPRLRQAQDWSGLIRVYRVLAEATSDPHERVQRWVGIRSILEERLSRPEAAYDAAQKVYELSGRPEELAALERCAVAAGRLEDFFGFLRELADRARPEDRLGWLRLRAERVEVLTRDPSLTVGPYREVLELSPEDKQALEALIRQYERLGATRELTATVRHRASLEQPTQERLPWLLRWGELAESSLGDWSSAVEAFEEVVRLAPERKDVLIRLDAIYHDQGAHEAEAANLERLVQQAEGDERVGFRLRLALLRAERLADPGGALAAFEAVLQEVPDPRAPYRARAQQGLRAMLQSHHEAEPQLALRIVERLEVEYRHVDAFEDLAQVLELRLRLGEDRSVRRDVRRTLAAIYEQQLDRPELAFSTLAAAFRETPGVEVEDELLRLAPELDADEEVAELMASLVPNVPDEVERLRLARRTAALLEALPERAERAAELYEIIRRLDPSDVEALRALERHRKKTGDVRGLVEVYREQLEHVSDPAGKAALWERIADLAETELGDVDLALQAYRQRLSFPEPDPSIRRRMAALCERDERWDELAKLCREEAEREEGDAAAQAWLRLAVLQRDKRADPSASVQAFLSALRIRPKDPGAIAGLGGFLRDGPPAVQPDAARALLPILEEAQAYDDLVKAYRILAETSPDAQERKEAFVAASGICERQRRFDEAFDLARLALREDLGDDAVRRRTEALATAHGHWDALAELYQNASDEALPLETAAAIRVELGGYYAQRDDTTRAVAEYQLALERVPNHPAAMEKLETLFSSVGDFSGLIDVFRRRIAQTEALDQRASLMRQMADLQSLRMADVAGAVATLRRLVELVPHDVGALERLDKLLAQTGRHSERREVLAQWVESVEGARSLEPRLVLARLEAGELGNPAEALLLAEQNLAQQPADDASRAFLNELLDGARAAHDGDSVIRIARVLSDACERARDPAGRVQALKAEAQATAEPTRKAEVLSEVADVYRTQLEQPDLAFAAMAQAVTQQPGREDLRRTLEALGSELGLTDEVQDTYQEVLTHDLAPEVASEIWRALGRLARSGAVEDAIGAWQQVRALLPQDLEASTALEFLYRQTERWAALAEVLEQRSRLADLETSDRLEALLELGGIWVDRLEEVPEALTAYRAAWELSRGDVRVLRALARLLEPQDDRDELIQVLDALQSRVGGAEKERTELRLAQLVEARDPERAAALYRQVLGRNPAARPAAEGLERALDGAGRWQELVDFLDAQRARADEREANRLQRRIALIRGTRLGSAKEAIASWQELLRRNPNDLEALEALRTLHRQEGDWDHLVDVLRRLIPLQAEAEPIKLIRFELAEVYLREKKEPLLATEAARRILDIEPHTAAELMHLESLFVEAQAYGEAVKVLSRRSELVDDVGEQIDVWMEVGRIYEELIGRTAGAAQAYEKVLELRPEHGPAFDRLARLCELNGDYRRLVDIIHRRIRAVEDPDLRLTLHLKVAELQERWLGSKDLAFTAACAALQESHGEPKAQELAERLAEQTDNWDVLVDLYEDLVDDLPLQRAYELRIRMAQILLDETDEPERAERPLEMALATQPGDPAASELMARLLQTQGRHRDLAVHLRDLVELTESMPARAALLKRVARIEETELGQPEAAILAWQRVLDIDPSDPEPAEQLDRIYREDGRPKARLDLLERRLEAAEGEDRVRLRVQIGQLLESELNQVDHAIEAYRDALELDPRHGPALAALERLFLQEERWAELRDVYRRQVEHAPDRSRAVDRLLKWAQVAEEHLHEPAEAIDALERVLQAGPAEGLTDTGAPADEEGRGLLARATALRSLERLYRQQGAPERVEKVLRARLEADAEDGPARAEIRVALAEVLRGPLARIDDAEDELKKALSERPDHLPAMQALATLREQRGDWGGALELLRRQADLLGRTAEAVELLHRIGRINLETTMDRASARRAFERAVELLPSHRPSLVALQRLSVEEGKAEEAVDWLIRLAENTSEPEERAERYFQAATDVLEGFDDVDRAVELLKLALEAVPTHVDALADVAELLFSDEQWEEAEVYITRLVEQLDPADDREELSRQHYRLAYISEKGDDPDRALRHYLKSYDFDNAYLPTLEGLGAALVEAGRKDDAQRVFQTILVQHRASLTDAEVVDLHQQVGRLAAELGQHDRARKSFAKALELDPTHPATLEDLARMCELTHDFEGAYDHRERLIQSLPPEERVESLIEQGELCRDRMQDAYRAIDAYQKARALAPDDVRVLSALVPLLEATRQFSGAIDLLERLSVLETDPARQVQNLCTVGRLKWQHERDAQGAVKAYEQALDIEPTTREALQQTEQILFETRNWAALEQAYVSMIQRLPKDAKKARGAMWRSIGELHLKVTRDPVRAAKAYEVLYKLDPADMDTGMLLASLYRQIPEKKAEALGIAQALLPRSKEPAPALRLFSELQYELGKTDASFCGLGALVLMRVANEDEVRAYRALAEKAPAWPSASLGDTQWRHYVLHPALRGGVGQISSILVRYLPDLFSARKQEAALNKKRERVDLGAKVKSRPYYYEVWGRVAQALGLRDVEHYQRPGSVQPPTLLIGNPPVLFAGGQHEVFKTMSSRQVAWIIARQMACLRPELSLVRALGGGDFVAVIEAAVQLVEPKGSGVAQPVDPRAIQAWLKALKAQGAEQLRDALTGPVQLAMGQGELQSLGAYLEAAEHTATRAAILMSGDWVTAARALGDADALVEVPYAQRVWELMQYTVSPEHLALRQGLGLRVG